MNRCEIKIDIIDDNYKDELIVALVNQGYEVYYNSFENCVCYIVNREDVNMIENLIDVKQKKKNITNNNNIKNEGYKDEE